MMPGKRTHDYLRHGTTSLFAASNTTDGTVISSLHRRHRKIEFKKFLQKIDSEVPGELDVHLVCDNYGTQESPAIVTWLQAHPRFQMHYTPTYSSWINQVERFFAYLTNDLLRRSDHRSVQALETDIRNWVAAWNENPKPFIWTKTAEQILESISRLLQRINGAAHQRLGASPDPNRTDPHITLRRNGSTRSRAACSTTRARIVVPIPASVGQPSAKPAFSRTSSRCDPGAIVLVAPVGCRADAGCPEPGTGELGAAQLLAAHPTNGCVGQSDLVPGHAAYS